MGVAHKTAGTLRRYDGTPAAVDGTGIGAGVVDRLQELGINVHDFIGGAQSTNPLYTNLRSQGYWNLREMFEFGRIDVDPDDDELRSQLCSLKWKVDTKGRIAVETKDEYKRRMRIKSPDAGDSAMMAAFDGGVMDIDLEEHNSVAPIMHDLLTVKW
jgi:phage terminase large subunit